ncbi:MAG TPA: glycosyltransferase family 2 protein [Terriglobales bacterium]|jgi:GT2 family glycosyltransferase|nr:glycosyltransferase family 2 protein [Terriglobales bacterium]
MVSVLICTFNSRRVLPACLQALRQQACGPLEVVIVDNASSDGTREILDHLQAPEYQVILNRENAGFAAAQNQAIRRARGEWLLSLNADVVLTPDFISQLLAAAEATNSRVGALCGKLLRWNPGGQPEFTSRIDSTGIYFTRNLRHFDRGSEQIDRGQYQETQYVFGATAAAALYRRAMVEDVSVEGEFFDEDFFAYREDADLAWRAQLLGWNCLYVPAAVGWHERRVTPERFRQLPLVINWHSVKNRFLMRWKNASLGTCLRLFIPITWRDLLIVGYSVLVDRRLLSALAFVWKSRERTRRKRHLIQGRRRVPESVIRAWFCNAPAARPMVADTGQQPHATSAPVS